MSLQQEGEGKREVKNAKSQFQEGLCKVSKILKISHLCAMVTAHYVREPEKPSPGLCNSEYDSSGPMVSSNDCDDSNDNDITPNDSNILVM